MLTEENGTQAPYSSRACIHQLFEIQAQKTPNSMALAFEGRRLTYQELNHKANQLAHYLIEEGVTPDDLVGICIERSPEMVIGILGILKAGAAYVPLDPDYPKSRLEYMVEDAKLGIVLTQACLEGKFEYGACRRFRMDDDASVSILDRHPNSNPHTHEQGLVSSNLAYVIYTSGSTGNPKGVMIEHQGLVNRIEWMRDKYGCDAADVILQKTPFSFDVSVWEFFLPLISGASIVLAKPRGHKDPIYTSELIKNMGVTKVHFVPSMLNAMLSSTKLAACESIRQVFCSGEALQPNTVALFFRQGIKAGLHNLYGPTEASIDVTCWECAETDTQRSSVPIGKPIQNIQLYIVDPQLHLVSPGVEGELLIGGVGLARGYLNRPALTAEKFIVSPFLDDPKSRVYRTGDLCRYMQDGNIEFIGRIDHQVKIRGFRIELGEIESTLLRHPAVKEAVVLSKDLTAGGNSLIAYIVCAEGLMVSDLGEYLASTLPDYMIPPAFVPLPELPLAPNGKVDRKSLLSLELRSVNNPSKKMVDMSFLQREIWQIWQKILGSDGFNVDDDLFEVGGDSITAIQIFTAVNDEFGVNIYVEELFSSPRFSIRWLAELVEKYQISLLGAEAYSALLAEIEGLSEAEVASLLLAAREL